MPLRFLRNDFTIARQGHRLSHHNGYIDDAVAVPFSLLFYQSTSATSKKVMPSLATSR
jgi:hypothetical protein